MSSDYDGLLNPLFEKCADEELLPIVEIINSKFSCNLKQDEQYKKNPNRPTTYIPAIVRELKAFGGNTFVNLYRGEGVDYSTIIRDIAKKLKIDFDPKEAVETIERKIITQMTERAYKKMSEEERKIFNEEVLDISSINEGGMGDVPGIHIMLIQIGLNQGGFIAHNMAIIMANTAVKTLLGQSMSIATRVALMRGLATFTNPLFIALSAAHTLNQIASPSYKILIPVALIIAALRLNYENHSAEVKNAFELLGLKGTETLKEVKSQFRNLMKQVHPDVLMAKGEDSNNQQAIAYIAACDILKQHFQH